MLRFILIFLTIFVGIFSQNNIDTPPSSYHELHPGKILNHFLAEEAHAYLNKYNNNEARA